MADVVDAAQTGAQAPPVSKAAPLQPTIAPSPIDDTPTEPATSPILVPKNGQLSFNFQQERLVHRRNLKGIRQGSSSMKVNGHQKNMRRSSTRHTSGSYKQWNREAREEAETHNQEFQHSMAEWKREIEKRGFKDHPSVPYGPPPKETSSTRALPEVHDALRQNDPSKAPASQPILKKAPPTTGRGRPAAFYSGDEPQRIGTAPVQPPPPPRPAPARDVQGQGTFNLQQLLPCTSVNSRPSISSTDRCASKADPRSGESGDPQASSTSTSSAGSAQQASTS